MPGGILPIHEISYLYHNNIKSILFTVCLIWRMSWLGTNAGHTMHWMHCNFLNIFNESVVQSDHVDAYPDYEHGCAGAFLYGYVCELLTRSGDESKNEAGVTESKNYWDGEVYGALRRICVYVCRIWLCVWLAERHTYVHAGSGFVDTGNVYATAGWMEIVDRTNWLEYMVLAIRKP